MFEFGKGGILKTSPICALGIELLDCTIPPAEGRSVFDWIPGMKLPLKDSQAQSTSGDFTARWEEFQEDRRKLILENELI